MLKNENHIAKLVEGCIWDLGRLPTRQDHDQKGDQAMRKILMKSDPGTILDRCKNSAQTTAVSASKKTRSCTKQMGKQEDEVLKHKH